MAKAKNLPDKEQRKLFEAYVAKWQLVLGLVDWRIPLVEKMAIRAMASVEFNSGARMAVVKLGDFGDTKIDAESLEDTAIHELLHIMLYDLVNAAADRDEGLEGIEHRVINSMERLLKNARYKSVN